MLTINQADLFYAAEYALEALLLLLCTWQRGSEMCIRDRFWASRL